MAHPLIDQLRFTRSEWLRGLAGVTEEDATQHCGKMNSIGWIVGHMAWHEHRYWYERAQNKVLYPQLNEMYAFRAPMSTPSLKDMFDIWRKVTKTVDPFLDALTTEKLQEILWRDGQPTDQTIGSGLRRMTYHYWFHTGEVLAIRQMLGQTNLPEFVGDIEQEAPYRPE